MDRLDIASTRSQRSQSIRILDQIDTDGPIQRPINATRSPVLSRACKDGAAHPRNNRPSSAVTAFELDQTIVTAANRVGVIVEVYNGFDWLGGGDGMPAWNRVLGSANVIQRGGSGVGRSRGLQLRC